MIMAKFWELFEKSVIITGTISTLIVGGAVYMAAAQIILPDWYQVALALVLGFFFGQKAGVNTAKQNAKG